MTTTVYLAALAGVELKLGLDLGEMIAVSSANVAVVVLFDVGKSAVNIGGIIQDPERFLEGRQNQYCIC